MALWRGNFAWGQRRLDQLLHFRSPRPRPDRVTSLGNGTQPAFFGWSRHVATVHADSNRGREDRGQLALERVSGPGFPAIQKIVTIQQLKSSGNAGGYRAFGCLILEGADGRVR
jgi:hypothetical protein